MRMTGVAGGRVVEEKTRVAGGGCHISSGHSAGIPQDTRGEGYLNMVEYTVQSSIPPKYHRGRRGQGLSALSSYCTNHFSGNKIPADDELPIISKKNIDCC